MLLRQRCQHNPTSKRYEKWLTVSYKKAHPQAAQLVHWAGGAYGTSSRYETRDRCRCLSTHVGLNGFSTRPTQGFERERCLDLNTFAMPTVVARCRPDCGRRTTASQRTLARCADCAFDPGRHRHRVGRAAARAGRAARVDPTNRRTYEGQQQTMDVVEAPVSTGQIFRSVRNAASAYRRPPTPESRAGVATQESSPMCQVNE